MRAIVVMFDSLNREQLPPYGGTEVIAPNFARLAERSITFRNSYAGSMPCMPARRELHTGRYNFLHRSWGPLEPFDDSVPEMLRRRGVASHLATDHMHYWEDGGATYHTRYSTYSLIRGQQGDPWKGRVADPAVADDDLRVNRSGTWRQDRVNRGYFDGLADHPQTRTFDAGLEFLHDNATEQDWFLQIETFDPHEPFFSDPSFEALYTTTESGPAGADYDWPEYMQVIEDDETVRRVRSHYSALVTMCDSSLGRVLDAMDEHQLWDDTMLIVCTDHGFLLGEHGWWGKSVPPWFDETIHTPLFIWDPRTGNAGTEQEMLVQTVDLGPTLLDHFDVALSEDMQGVPISAVLRGEMEPRSAALFGAFGGHVSVTDGRYVYMRACATVDNAPLVEHTLMPTHMRGFFTPDEMATATLVDSLPFSKGMPVLTVDGRTATNPYVFGTRLYDLATDPDQEVPLLDGDLEHRMALLLRDAMVAAQSPASQFERLGLPVTGDVLDENLLCRAQLHAVADSSRQAPSLEEFPQSPWSVVTPVGALMSHPDAAEILRRYCRPFITGPFARICESIPLYRAAALMIGVLPWSTLFEVAAELAEIRDTTGADL